MTYLSKNSIMFDETTLKASNVNLMEKMKFWHVTMSSIPPYGFEFFFKETYLIFNYV